MPKVMVNDVIFNYEQQGEGKPSIVFISGYTCDLSLWKPIADRLSGEHQVLGFDNQAIGESIDNNEILTISSMANNIKGLLEKLNIEECVLVGFAMGTSLALEIARHHPQCVSKLILLSPVASWSQPAITHIDTLINLRKNNDLHGYFSYLYDTPLFIS